mgnify:CR=1 FL=1|jgi:hypothetical protein
MALLEELKANLSKKAKIVGDVLERVNNLKYYLGFGIFCGYFPAKESDIPFLVNNGANIIESAGAYLTLSTLFGKKVGASTFLIASAMEIGQYYGMQGTFDPKDFVAYGVGVLGGMGLEKIIDNYSAKRKEKNKEKE